MVRASSTPWTKKPTAGTSITVAPWSPGYSPPTSSGGSTAQPFGVPTEPVQVKQRIVPNYFTGKRMLQAMHMPVQRHEQAFGLLETDVQKRVIGGARAGRVQT